MAQKLSDNTDFSKTIDMHGCVQKQLPSLQNVTNKFVRSLTHIASRFSEVNNNLLCFSICLTWMVQKRKQTKRTTKKRSQLRTFQLPSYFPPPLRPVGLERTLLMSIVITAITQNLASPIFCSVTMTDTFDNAARSKVKSWWTIVHKTFVQFEENL